jgi:phage FluMu protein Com
MMKFIRGSYLILLLMITMGTPTATFASDDIDTKNTFTSADQYASQHLHIQCPKCKGEMEKGVIADYEHGGIPRTSEWGTEIEKVDKVLAPSIVKHARLVTTYRCTKCGYLESYATAPPKETKTFF